MSLGRLGDYEVLERIGAGGMGVVFRARDIGLDALRAIKVIAPEHADDPEYLRRLRHEAQTVARLQHPNIAACHHCGEAIPEPLDLLGPTAPGLRSRPVFFMAMEYVEGDDLGDYAAHRRLPVREVVHIALQIASGLEAAHEAGVFHRDLKPGNIRLTRGRVVKLLDFGLARSNFRHDIASGAATQQPSGDSVVGTPMYMAPEQARRGHASTRSDLYSLGVVLYELLAGRMPYSRGRPGWESDDPEAWATDPIGNYRPDVPARLTHVLKKLLQFEPANRYPDANLLRRDLERLAAPPKRVGRWVSAAAGFILLAFLAVQWFGGWIPFSWDPTERTVAVLEIESSRADPELQLLASGLAADIYDGLRKARGVNALRPRDRIATPAAVREELGAGSLLRGAVTRRGAATLLDIELLDTGTRQRRWHGDFVLEPGTWFVVRERIVAEVSTHLTPPYDRVTRGAVRGGPKAAAYVEYLRGVAWLDADEPAVGERAAACFDRALKLDPGFALAWAGQARALWWCYIRDRDTSLVARAERSAERALTITPDLVEAQLVRARIYGGTNRNSKAIGELLDIVHTNPASEEAQRQLGEAYLKSGQLDRAESCFRRGVEIGPVSLFARTALAGFLQRVGRLQEAEEAWSAATKMSPGSTRARAGLAGAYISQARYADAARIYDQLPESLATGPRWSNMATAYFYVRRLDKALHCYLRAIEKAPDHPDIRMSLGDCYTRMDSSAAAREQYWEALRLTDRALAVDAADSRLMVMRVLLLTKVGDRARALPEFERHLHQTPGDSELQYWMAKAAALLGHDADAIMLLRLARANGMSPALFRDEDEFIELRRSEEFRKLLRS